MRERSVDNLPEEAESGHWHPLLSARHLVLGSSSPRRAALLESTGIPFDIVHPNVPEDREPVGDPEKTVRSNAERKADWVAQRSCGKTDLILGADTVVVLESKILGKPADEREAIAALRLLSGKEHQVFTGLALIDKVTGSRLTGCERTAVRFRKLKDSEITWYVRTAHPLDKAGAYGIQGEGAVLVESVQGCYYNVVGLPVARLIGMLDQLELESG